jgi:N-acetylglutamate synthase-like GNAT family acetyltransferase
MNIKIISGLHEYTPGAIGRVTQMHAAYYSRHHGFGLFFEAMVAKELSDLLSRFDPSHDGFWTAFIDGAVVGSVAIDGSAASTKGARLRFLIVAPEFQGRGIGNTLVSSAVNFCREKGLKKIYLTTFEGLDAARHLYEKAGFEMVMQETGSHWGKPEVEQVFELSLDE